MHKFIATLLRSRYEIHLTDCIRVRLRIQLPRCISVGEKTDIEGAVISKLLCKCDIERNEHK